MGISSEAVRLVEQDLLLKADVLAHYLNGLATNDAERAMTICAEVVRRLKTAVSAESDFDSKSENVASDRRPNLRLAARDEIEEFIVENLANSPSGLSVQQIVDLLDEADFAIKRATLVVRLHRMVQAGKLTSPTHGHYDLSDVEINRRKSA